MSKQHLCYNVYMRYIYSLIDPKDQKPRYVGQTSRTPKMRFKEHCKILSRPRLPVQKWIKKLDQIGLLKELKIAILEEVSEEEWKNKEMFWIKNYKNKYNLLNITEGGEGVVGYKHSQETRKKIKEKRATQTFSEETRRKFSLAHIGNQSAKGIHYKRNPGDLKKTWETRRRQGNDKSTEETRKKLSESHKGIYPSKETRRKLSESHKGHTVSEETRKKIGDSQRGEKHYNWGKHHSEETLEKMRKPHHYKINRKKYDKNMPC